MKHDSYVHNRRAWHSYNKNRINRALKISPGSGDIAFHVIPFLIHTNHPELPGYEEGVSHCGGIYLYDQADDELNIVRRGLPGYNLTNARSSMPVSGFQVESLLLMGSIGTVAHGKDSDYDYWVIFDESRLSKIEVAALKRKLAAIEKWATQKKMETHFFLLDAEKTRNNDFGESDKESAGSSQALILKEEFYRTAILVAGKDPLWWILPARLTDKEYEEHRQRIFDEGKIDENEVVDLGNIESISTGELFGALLWQFNKAISSPYKSAMKMALMKKFIGSDSADRLLCNVLKGAIQANPKKIDQADPYLLMFDSIRRHYLKEGRGSAAHCLEKCFYLKSLDNPVKSTRDEANLPYKERTLRACIRLWKWDKYTLEDINFFKSWDPGKVAQLASQVHNFMLDTYKELKDDIDKQPNVKSLITDRDLTILGRKLFTIYDKKDKDKIEFVKRVMDENMELEALTFKAAVKRGRPPMWEVYRGDIVNLAAKKRSIDKYLVKKGPDLVALMMWLVQNHVCWNKSLLYFIPESTLPVSLQDLQKLMGRISELLPPVSIGDLKNDDLVKSARAERILVVVNLLSQRWKQDIDFIHILYTTSWGESFCHALPADKGLPKLLNVLNQTRRDFSINNRKMFDIFTPKGETDVKLGRKMKDFLLKKFRRAI